MKLTEESSTRKMRTVVSFLTGFSFEDVGIKNMKSKKEKRTKKHIFGKIILLAIGVLLIWLISDICITEIYAAKIPHWFASAEEGRERLLANTEYYSQLTQTDMNFRLGHENATLDELLERSTAEIKNYNIIEKYIYRAERAYTAFL